MAEQVIAIGNDQYPLHVAERGMRLRLASEMVGHRVCVEVRPLRGARDAEQNYILTGWLLSAAVLDHGTTRDVVVVRVASRPRVVDGVKVGELHDDRAVSLAQVHRIKVVNAARWGRLTTFVMEG
jgi:hypothetical protein